jgi:hypothetical protein
MPEGFVLKAMRKFEWFRFTNADIVCFLFTFRQWIRFSLNPVNRLVLATDEISTLSL